MINRELPKCLDCDDRVQDMVKMRCYGCAFKFTSKPVHINIDLASGPDQSVSTIIEMPVDKDHQEFMDNIDLMRENLIKDLVKRHSPMRRKNPMDFHRMMQRHLNEFHQQWFKHVFNTISHKGLIITKEDLDKFNKGSE